jgi:polyisoprenyl-teichoic acid--peptidoglycan teichoic acid transferase
VDDDAHTSGTGYPTPRPWPRGVERTQQIPVVRPDGRDRGSASPPGGPRSWVPTQAGNLPTSRLQPPNGGERPRPRPAPHPRPTPTPPRPLPPRSQPPQPPTGSKPSPRPPAGTDESSPDTALDHRPANTTEPVIVGLQSSGSPSAGLPDDGPHNDGPPSDKPTAVAAPGSPRDEPALDETAVIGTGSPGLDPIADPGEAVRSERIPPTDTDWEPWPDTVEPPARFGRALLAAAAATIAPGSGHLMLGHRRSGAAILGVFLAGLAAVVALLLTVPRANLIQTVLSSRSLIIGAAVCMVAALAWIGVIIRTYLIGRPAALDPGRRAIGALTVCCLCLLVAAPLGYGANVANSQRNLLETLFRGGDGGTPAAEAIAKPRLNILLVGSDAGPDRTGARTDTMMVASIDTRSGRTTLFGLPRNIGYAQFPVGSPMYEEFPEGFHNRADPTSGDYLLNAVYAWGHQHPELAPRTPTADPGLNLLHQTVSQMLGLQLDYYAEVNMAGFASIIDALGGITVDVGPERIAIGGITPSGRLVRPDGYIEPGVQKLDGAQALAFARSRTNSSDYARMGRQRCLLQNILAQKSPTDVLANFRGVAAATSNSVSTNIPQAVLPALATLAGSDTLTLESLSFDPDLPDPEESNGRFNTGHPDFPYMRQVVQDAINRDVAAVPPVLPTPTPSPSASSTATPDDGPTSVLPPARAVPTSVAASCG